MVVAKWLYGYGMWNCHLGQITKHHSQVFLSYFRHDLACYRKCDSRLESVNIWHMEESAARMAGSSTMVLVTLQQKIRKCITDISGLQTAPTKGGAMILKECQRTPWLGCFCVSHPKSPNCSKSRCLFWGRIWTNITNLPTFLNYI